LWDLRGWQWDKLYWVLDVVINVIDASLLSRSLEFTIQLLDMDIPMVICLNMMDEAGRKGIPIDTEKPYS
jgi:ferrous iron transport protein B